MRSRTVNLTVSLVRMLLLANLFHIAREPATTHRGHSTLYQVHLARDRTRGKALAQRYSVLCLPSSFFLPGNFTQTTHCHLLLACHTLLTLTVNCKVTLQIPNC
jgi:hypothetical protein